MFRRKTEFCYIDPRYDGPRRSPKDGESATIRAGTVAVFAGYLRWVTPLQVLTPTEASSEWCSIRLGCRKHYYVDLPVRKIVLIRTANVTPLAKCLESTPEWFRDDV